MKKLKLSIAYDGTNYQGWQSQPHHNTIADTLQNSFFKKFEEEVCVIGASRTDAGVHALGQVAQIQTNLNIEIPKLIKAWNSALPTDIKIRSAEVVDESFYPGEKVIQKTYWYHLFLKPPLPFFARYGWHYYFINQVDFEKFYKCLELYIGQHDFASFCKMEEDRSTIRTIDDIKIKKIKNFGMIQIEIKGKSFLRYQIRRMIGYALDVARQSNLELSYLKNMLDHPNDEQTLVKAEASGLCLRKIIYEK